ncbi:MAG: hypothetical protein ACFFAI_08140 [Promethearchaeota archaeon]
MVRDRICYNNFNPCPCKVLDLKKKIAYCNFINMFAESQITDKANHSKKADSLLKKVCPEVRNEILHHDYRAEQLQKRKKEFLKRVQPEDICFCTAEIENVIFLEYPSNVHGDVKYKTFDGRISEAPSFCFSIISKGDKCAEYETNDKDKMESYERLARKNGFRVEVEQLKNGYLLKIYGDKQEEVDEFVVNLNNDLVIDDFYDY